VGNLSGGVTRSFGSALREVKWPVTIRRSQHDGRDNSIFRNVRELTVRQPSSLVLGASIRSLSSYVNGEQSVSEASNMMTPTVPAYPQNPAEADDITIPSVLFEWSRRGTSSELLPYISTYADLVNASSRPWTPADISTSITGLRYIFAEDRKLAFKLFAAIVTKLEECQVQFEPVNIDQSLSILAYFSKLNEITRNFVRIITRQMSACTKPFLTSEIAHSLYSLHNFNHVDDAEEFNALVDLFPQKLRAAVAASSVHSQQRRGYHNKQNDYSGLEIAMAFYGIQSLNIDPHILFAVVKELNFKFQHCPPHTIDLSHIAGVLASIKVFRSLHHGTLADQTLSLLREKLLLIKPGQDGPGETKDYASCAGEITNCFHYMREIVGGRNLNQHHGIHVEVLVPILHAKLVECSQFENLSPSQLVAILQGLENFPVDCAPVNDVLKTVVQLMDSCREPFGPQEISIALHSLKFKKYSGIDIGSRDQSEIARRLVQVIYKHLNQLVSRGELLTIREVANAMYGLRNLGGSSGPSSSSNPGGSSGRPGLPEVVSIITCLLPSLDAAVQHLVDFNNSATSSDIADHITGTDISHMLAALINIPDPNNRRPSHSQRDTSAGNGDAEYAYRVLRYTSNICRQVEIYNGKVLVESRSPDGYPARKTVALSVGESCLAVYALNRFRQSERSVREILSFLLPSLQQHIPHMEAKQLRLCFGGLQSMKIHPAAPQVEEILALLNHRLLAAINSGDLFLDGTDVAYCFLGIKSMNADSAVVRNFLSIMTRYLRSCQDGRSCSMALIDLTTCLYSIRFMSSAHPEVREMIRTLGSYLSRNEAPMTTQGISFILTSMKYLRDDDEDEDANTQNGKNNNAVTEYLQIIASKLFAQSKPHPPSRSLSPSHPPPPIQLNYLDVYYSVKYLANMRRPETLDAVDQILNFLVPQLVQLQGGGVPPSGGGIARDGSVDMKMQTTRGRSSPMRLASLTPQRKQELLDATKELCRQDGRAVREFMALVKII
jgi:hypothetical protein